MNQMTPHSMHQLSSAITVLCRSTICAQGTACVRPVEVPIRHIDKYTRHIFEKLTEIHIIGLSPNTERFPPHRSLWVVGFIQWAWSECTVASPLKGPHPDVIKRVALHRGHEVTLKGPHWRPSQCFLPLTRGSHSLSFTYST